jgi:hypothetical protein
MGYPITLLNGCFAGHWRPGAGPAGGRPHTVFEGKYFLRGKVTAAETALASHIYQAFFYRGLAKLPATKTHPAWDYDYACVLAYDATQEGTLVQAWDGLRSKDRAELLGGCWDLRNGSSRAVVGCMIDSLEVRPFLGDDEWAGQIV